jgi:hypothetical protein
MRIIAQGLAGGVSQRAIETIDYEFPYLGRIAQWFLELDAGRGLCTKVLLFHHG